MPFFGHKSTPVTNPQKFPVETPVDSILSHFCDDKPSTASVVYPQHVHPSVIAKAIQGKVVMKKHPNLFQGCISLADYQPDDEQSYSYVTCKPDDGFKREADNGSVRSIKQESHVDVNDVVLASATSEIDLARSEKSRSKQDDQEKEGDQEKQAGQDDTVSDVVSEAATSARSIKGSARSGCSTGRSSIQYEKMSRHSPFMQKRPSSPVSGASARSKKSIGTPRLKEGRKSPVCTPLSECSSARSEKSTKISSSRQKGGTSNVWTLRSECSSPMSEKCASVKDPANVIVKEDLRDSNPEDMASNAKNTTPSRAPTPNQIVPTPPRASTPIQALPVATSQFQPPIPIYQNTIYNLPSLTAEALERMGLEKLERITKWAGNLQTWDTQKTPVLRSPKPHRNFSRRRSDITSGPEIF